MQLPVTGTQSECSVVTIVLLEQMVAAGCAGLTQKCGQHIEAVHARIVTQLLTAERGKAGGEVDRANHFITCPRLHISLPPRDQRRACAAFVDTVLSAGQRAGGAV